VLDPDKDSDPGFTVVDRRRRGEEAPEARPEGPPPRSPAASPGPDLPGPPSGAPRPDFASFCVMLYSDALIQLGQAPDPVTGERRQDLDQARFTIDLVAMIREKTEGNRTPEESAVLDEILTNLRMAFVRASRLR